MIGIYLVRTCLASEGSTLTAMQELRLVDVLDDKYLPVVAPYVRYLNNIHSKELDHLESEDGLCYAEYESRPYPMRRASR